MGYLIAAYAVVVVSLIAYGLWIQLQRRALRRPGEERRTDGASDPHAP
jgi:hypothetical protein